jgi:lysophospholipase L1-like esterase
MTDADSKRTHRAAFVFITLMFVVVMIEVMGSAAYFTLIPAERRERLELMLGEESTWKNSAVRYRAHPFLQYTGRPDFLDPTGYAPFADDGFRKPDPRASTDPRFRIVVLGGSTTYGIIAQKTEDAWPAMLAQALRESGLDVDVKNAALPSYNSWHLVAATSFFLQSWRPDLVILHTGFNDAFARAFDDEGREDARTLLRAYRVAELTDLEQVVLGVSRAARVVWLPRLEREKRVVGDLVGDMFTPIPSDDAMRAAATRAQGTHFRRNVETLLTLVAAAGARPVLMPEPFNVDQVARPVLFDIAFRGASAHAEILAETARARDLPLIDLRTRFASESDFIDDVHLTEENEMERVKIITPLVAALLQERARANAP